MLTLRADRHAVPIDMLPDDVLLEIFDLCLRDPTASGWRALVHVCQRWRRIVFASPRRLGLRLKCSSGTPVRTNLPFWPVTLPLAIDYRHDYLALGGQICHEDEDNILAVLGHPRRVHRITIHGGLLTRKVVTTMRKSFPALTNLDLEWDADEHRGTFRVIPKRFLGKTAPRLQLLRLRQISFPQLPTFLLSTRNLVTLKLKEIPPEGCISPEALVGGLTALTRLTTLSISFYDEDDSPSDELRSHPDPLARVILPTLTNFHYIGRSQYLEDFLARIDTPLLDTVKIEYVSPDIQVSQLSRFIERTENLKLDQFTCAEVTLFHENICFKLDCPRGKRSLSLNILGQEYLEIRTPGMAHLLSQLTATFSNVDDLFAHGNYVESDGMEITECVPFFRLFPAVETLRLSRHVASHFTSALEETTEENVIDVLPALRLIRFLEGEDDSDSVDYDDIWDKLVKSIERFLSLRQLSGCPVTVINPEDDSVDSESEENP